MSPGLNTDTEIFITEFHGAVAVNIYILVYFMR
jgi:hypothetical protein